MLLRRQCWPDQLAGGAVEIAIFALVSLTAELDFANPLINAGINFVDKRKEQGCVAWGKLQITIEIEGDFESGCVATAGHSLADDIMAGLLLDAHGQAVEMDVRIAGGERQLIEHGAKAVTSGAALTHPAQVGVATDFVGQTLVRLAAKSQHEAKATSSDRAQVNDHWSGLPTDVGSV